MHVTLRGSAALLLVAAAAAQEAPAPASAAVPAAPAAPVGRALLPADAGPAIAPHVAVGIDGTVLVVYAAQDEIRCVLSRDGGRSFAPPERVGEAGWLAAGPTRGPRAAVTPDALVVLAVCGETPGGGDGNLLAWRSDDRGARWKGPVRINDEAASAREGLHAAAAGPDGAVLAVWLDQRGHGTELRGDWSRDGGATWDEDQLLYASPDGSICECCAPAAAFDPSSGNGLVLWRNSLGGARDMYLQVLRDANQPLLGDPQRLGTEHWELQACPMAGGGVAVSNKGELLSFWRRGTGLFTAAPGLGEAPVGEGREATAAAGPDGFHLAWTDGQGGVLAARAAYLGGVQEARPLGRGLNVSAAGAVDGLGPVLAVWETGDGNAASLRYEVLAERGPRGD